ncbi:MAG TPA: GYD domain-containing protein [Roseiarcus sp.]|nr:GYD domain-containing protein [Roseiarcus sp.]
MPTYVTLTNFTHQGIQNVKDTTKRADAFKAAAKKAGCTVKEVYWTQGQYDSVLIMDAPDEASATALLMSLGKLGNVRTQTLRAFTAAELAPILDKVV